MRSPTDIALDRHLSPVNRTSARVVGRGVHWTPDKQIDPRESQNPLPYGPIALSSNVRAGMKFGFFTVLGRAGDEHRSKTKGAPYVCRCLCGMYAIRRARAVLNPANDKDACGRCLQKQFLTRRNEFRTYGRNRE